jgi:hypothetical protein
MTWQTGKLKAPLIFVAEESVDRLRNLIDFKLDKMCNPFYQVALAVRRNRQYRHTVNQVIMLWACSVRSKRRHGECAGEHSASLCAPSIFSNEVSANVARQSSFSLRGHNTENTQKQGSESLPTFSLSEVLDVCRSVIRPPFTNRKTMKNKNNNPFFVSSIQSCNTNRRTAGRLRSAGFTTAVLSVILGCSSTAALAGLAVIGVNLALIWAVVLLIYIIFGCLASRSVTNCHRIQ